MTTQRILTEKLIAVRFTGSRYMTSQVKGKRSSSNRTPDIAVMRLGQKLFGAQFSHAQMCLDLDEGDRKKYWSLFFWQLLDQPRKSQ